MSDHPTAAAFETPRIRLRSVVVSDEDAVFTLLSDERVVRHMRFPLFARERARAFVTRLQSDPDPGQPRQFVLALVERGTDSVIGLCGLVFNSSEDEGEVWYLLSPMSWGRGLITEAVGELVRHAFQDLALHRVWASCLPENPASARVLEKLRFRQEGYHRKSLRIHGSWRDSFLYAILAEEWLPGGGSTPTSSLQLDVRESYDSAADAYAEHLFHELEHKPLDRHLLNRFAEAIRDKGKVADLGCGPGHVTRYLSQLGVMALGIDISPRMVARAALLNPALRFQVGDMTNLDFADRSLAGALSFYSIVHFAPEQLASVFTEIRRVIADAGLFLVAFHAGGEVVHTDDLFGARVSLDFRFHQPAAVLKILTSTGFAPLEWSEREPYDGVEYPSRRCYVLARAT